MRRADLSSRGVLPTVMRRCVLSRNHVNEETLAQWEGGCFRAKNKRVNITNKCKILRRQTLQFCCITVSSTLYCSSVQPAWDLHHDTIVYCAVLVLRLVVWVAWVFVCSPIEGVLRCFGITHCFHLQGGSGRCRSNWEKVMCRFV